MKPLPVSDHRGSAAIEGLMVKTVMECAFFMGPTDGEAVMAKYDVQALGGRRVAYRPCAMAAMHAVKSL
jgi:negative regulator of sigma E activity